jgi:hypothetical protein
MSGTWSRAITDAEAARIAAEINCRGYGTLSNYVSEAELKPVRAIARAAVRASGGEYALWAGTDAFAGTVLSELPHSAAFRDLCRRLLEHGAGNAAGEADFYQTFRCIQGGTAQSRRHSYAFHYDGCVLTTILPVAIPENAPHGDLLIIPNTRSIRRWYLSSLLETNLVKSAPVQLILRMLARRRKLNTIAVRLKPGDIYFLWGYRSLHANEACGRDTLRATAIFQYGNPHEHTRLCTMLRNVMPRIGLRKLYWSSQY